MARILVALALLAVVAGQQSPPPKAKPVIKRALIVFGDSLSDNGNYFATWGNNTNPLANITFANATKATKLYYKGRFTNSPGVWNDKLTRKVQKMVISNFAYGGATVCNKNYTPSAFINSIPYVQDQVKLYLAKLKTEPKYAKAMKDRLRIATVWGGANDIQFTLKYAPANAPALPPMIAECTKNVTKLLLDNGHKIVIVGSVPPIDLSPVAVKNGPAAQALVKGLVFACNNAIKAVVAELQAKYTSRQVLYWDNNAAITAGIVNWKAAGFKHNNTETCLTVGPNYESLIGIPPLAVCKKPADYIFWDPQHPTSTGHDLITDSMVRFLTSSGVITKDDLVPVKPPKGLRRLLQTFA